MSSAEKIRHLKLLINAVDVHSQRERWSAPYLVNGITRGIIAELRGPQKYEWFIQFLKTNPKLDCFWIERTQRILPTALAQRGVNLQQLTFAILGDDPFLALRQILQSQLYPVVLCSHFFSDFKMLRALQLITEKSNSTLFLMNDREVILPAQEHWPIATQLYISKSAVYSDSRNVLDAASEPDAVSSADTVSQTSAQRNPFHIEILKDKWGAL